MATTTTFPIEQDVPGWGMLQVHTLTLDFTGTLSFRGELVEGVAWRLTRLAKMGLDIWVITADTNNTAREQLKELVEKGVLGLKILTPEEGGEAKIPIVEALGAEHVIAIGNGRNDVGMFLHARLGIAVNTGEGTAKEASDSAHIANLHILEALDLLLQGEEEGEWRCLKATLRD